MANRECHILRKHFHVDFSSSTMSSEAGRAKDEGISSLPARVCTKTLQTAQTFHGVCLSLVKKNVFGSLSVSSKVEKNNFMKNFVQESVAKIQQSPVRARYLVKNT